jgi:hypothetical protein
VMSDVSGATLSPSQLDEGIILIPNVCQALSHVGMMYLCTDIREENGSIGRGLGRRALAFEQWD